VGKTCSSSRIGKYGELFGIDGNSSNLDMKSPVNTVHFSAIKKTLEILSLRWHDAGELVSRKFTFHCFYTNLSSFSFTGEELRNVNACAARHCLETT